METKLTIWDQEVNIDLNRQDKYFIGINGSGKTMLLNAIATHFDGSGTEYISYDAMEAIHEIKFYESITLEEEELFLTFLEKIVENTTIIDGIKHFTVKSSQHLYKSLGNGHLRLLNMLIKATRTDVPTFFLMDLPETSIHLHVLHRLLDYIRSANPFLTCLIATHSPVLIPSNQKSIIHMSSLLEN